MADYRQIAHAAAVKYGVSPNIFLRQIEKESGFDPRALSPAGATGIAQIMPRYHDVDATDPVASLDYAARLMAGYLKQYGGDYSLALAAYNAGPGAVEQYGGVPPFAETQGYVSKILGEQPPQGGAPMPDPYDELAGQLTGRQPPVATPPAPAAPPAPEQDIRPAPESGTLEDAARNYLAAKQLREEIEAQLASMSTRNPSYSAVQSSLNQARTNERLWFNIAYPKQAAPKEPPYVGEVREPSTYDVNPMSGDIKEYEGRRRGFYDEAGTLWKDPDPSTSGPTVREIGGALYQWDPTSSSWQLAIAKPPSATSAAESAAAQRLYWDQSRYPEELAYEREQERQKAEFERQKHEDTKSNWWRTYENQRDQIASNTGDWMMRSQIQAMPYAVDPSWTSYPGFEAGGPVERLYRMGGSTSYTPPVIPRTTFDPIAAWRAGRTETRR